MEEEARIEFTTIDSWPFVFDEHWHLVDDVPCPACGYNLRGTLQSGRCAECGVDLVAAFDQVADRAANWLLCVKWAQVLIVGSVGLPAMLFLVGVFLFGYAEWNVIPATPLLWWTPAILLTVGWSLFTSSWPATFGIEFVRFARWLSCGSMIVAVWGFVFQFQSVWWGPFSGGSPGWVGLVNGTSAGVAVTSGWWYCKLLSQVLADLPRNSREVRLQWLSPASLLAVLTYLGFVVTH